MDSIASACNQLRVELTGDQFAVLQVAIAAYRARRNHLITGYAGSGKTTLVQVLAAVLRAEKAEIALTAPTHKAVGVLARKIKAAGINGVNHATIHRLLSLSPKPNGERMVFQRRKDADPVTAHLVVIDECSMVSAELMAHIRQHLDGIPVLFVGDPAQLPPVGEEASETFGTDSHSHLDTIVRQAAGNPVLSAAHTIRQSQGGPMDWSWCRDARDGRRGVFLPRHQVSTWMQRAFTSEAFAKDADTHRYLCWTNDRVAEVNARVRQWLYGDNIPTPFMPGERAMYRAPLFRDGDIVANTNEEATALSIEASEAERGFQTHRDLHGWTVKIPVWRMMMRSEDGLEYEADLIRDRGPFDGAVARITQEARGGEAKRWGELHAFKGSFATLQSVYALTIHTSQGSTFKNVFLDIGDVRRRVGSNVLEAQQLLYVGATRPSDTLVLVGP